MVLGRTAIGQEALVIGCFPLNRSIASAHESPQLALEVNPISFFWNIKKTRMPATFAACTVLLSGDNYCSLIEVSTVCVAKCHRPKD
jgi:hypothetical protein